MEVKESLRDLLCDQIPMARALEIEVREADFSKVEIFAPLGPSRNHLATAFGGSLGALLILSCYGWLFLRLQQLGYVCHVLIKEGKTQYHLPVSEDIRSICLAPSESDFQLFLNSFTRKGRGRIYLSAHVQTSQGRACSFQGEFVAQKMSAQR
jgi:thioesterase domain-containing protein